jgi:hypothetical protein
MIVFISMMLVITYTKLTYDFSVKGDMMTTDNAAKIVDYRVYFSQLL